MLLINSGSYEYVLDDKGGLAHHVDLFALRDSASLQYEYVPEAVFDAPLIHPANASATAAALWLSTKALFPTETKVRHAKPWFGEGIVMDWNTFATSKRDRSVFFFFFVHWTMTKCISNVPIRSLTKKSDTETKNQLEPPRANNSNTSSPAPTVRLPSPTSTSVSVYGSASALFSSASRSP
jgi:hypothetical protein